MISSSNFYPNLKNKPIKNKNHPRSPPHIPIKTTTSTKNLPHHPNIKKSNILSKINLSLFHKNAIIPLTYRGNFITYPHIYTHLTEHQTWGSLCKSNTVALRCCSPRYSVRKPCNHQRSICRVSKLGGRFYSCPPILKTTHTKCNHHFASCHCTTTT